MWLLTLVPLLVMLVGTWLTLRQLGSPPPHLDAPYALYPVSILKPLKGADSGLQENLEGFFRLDYPDYELIFSVAQIKDPASRIVWKLIEKYPNVRARLVIGDTDAGANPKVNNLIQSYSLAENDWILISDSNVRVRPDYLKRLVAHLENDVGMVTAVVAGHGARGFGGELEATFLNTFYARWMVLSASAGRPCVVGKCMLFRRSVAERFGGIRILARYLAEDFMAGEAMRKLGLRVILARDPVDQHIGAHSISGFWDRHIRWGRLRKAQAPIAFAVEPFFGPVLSSFFSAWVTSASFDLPFWSVFAAHWVIWGFCDLALVRRMSPRFPAYALLTWMVRELLALPLWFHIASGNTVKWRGRRMEVRAGGLLVSS